MLVEDAAGNIYDDGAPAPSGGRTEQSWGAWLQSVAQYGLQRKWDAEYLLPFTAARQVPYNAGTPLTNRLGFGAGVSPVVMVGAGVAAIGLLVWALKD